MIFNVFRNSNKGYWYKCKNGEILICIFFSNILMNGDIKLFVYSIVSDIF